MRSLPIRVVGWHASTTTKATTHLAQRPDAQGIQAPMLVNHDGQPVHDVECKGYGYDGTVFVFGVC